VLASLAITITITATTVTIASASTMSLRLHTTGHTTGSRTGSGVKQKQLVFHLKLPEFTLVSSDLAGQVGEELHLPLLRNEFVVKHFTLGDFIGGGDAGGAPTGRTGHAIDNFL
jgi:hypothetical protein